MPHASPLSPVNQEKRTKTRETLVMESTVQGETIEAPRKPEAPPASPGMIRFEVEIPAEAAAEFDLMMYELFTGQRDRPKRYKQEDAAIAVRAGEALATIVAAIRAHPGTAQAGRLVQFLASVYNGADYPFDLSALRALGARLANACLAYLNYDRLAVSDLSTHLGDGGRELRAWIRLYGLKSSSNLAVGPR